MKLIARIALYAAIIAISAFLGYRFHGGPGNPPPQVVPQFHDAQIWDKGQGPVVDDVPLSRTRKDFVRWVNNTDKTFTLHLRDNPNTSDDDKGPFPEFDQPIVVMPHTTTGWYRVHERAANGGKRVRFAYYSDPTVLEGSGGPGDPGMVVED